MTKAVPAILRQLAVIGLTLGVVGIPTNIQAAAPPHAYISGPRSIQVILSGLNNPRGLTFGPDGDLYIAEAGLGSGPAGQSTCRHASPGHDNACRGMTGSIMRVALSNGIVTSHSRAYDRLASSATATGTNAIGPSGIAFLGKTPYVIEQATDPASPNGSAASNYFGDLLRVSSTAQPAIVANISHFQAVSKPYKQPDKRLLQASDPYAVVADPSSKSVLVVDSAANDVVRVRVDNRVSTVAIFPDQTRTGYSIACSDAHSAQCYQSMPDSLTRGPDNALYVGELGGAGAVPGQQRIYRLMSPSGVQTPTVYAQGLTSISSLAFAPDGGLFVVEMFEMGRSVDLSGALIRIAPNGGRSMIIGGQGTGLVMPAGVVVSPDGKYVYVTNYSSCGSTSPSPCPKGGAQLVRINLIGSAVAVPATVPPGGHATPAPSAIAVVTPLPSTSPNYGVPIIALVFVIAIIVFFWPRKKRGR